jgi:type IV secretory pathway VirB2 component (pilin)
MTIAPQQSLFESSGASPMASSLDWVSGVLFGELAIGLSIIAVAMIGFVMLTGRMPFRQGGRVALGVFVLLSAPTIAAGFSTALQGSAGSAPITDTAELAEPPRDLSPADYDPYAGASLRRE